MNWNKATKKQLLQIALSEDCPLEFKHLAAAELQKRGEVRYTRNCARKHAGRRAK
jgi:hypothetical protein